MGWGGEGEVSAEGEGGGLGMAKGEGGGGGWVGALDWNKVLGWLQLLRSLEGGGGGR